MFHDERHFFVTTWAKDQMVTFIYRSSSYSVFLDLLNVSRSLIDCFLDMDTSLQYYLNRTLAQVLANFTNAPFFAADKNYVILPM